MSCADGGEAAAGEDGEQRRSSSPGGLPNPYTCYVSACPEPRNLTYKHPEFLICYKCPADGDESNDEDQPVAKYFCYPISLVPAIGSGHDYQQQQRRRQHEDGEMENIFFEYPAMQPQPMYSNHHLQQQQQQQQQHHFYPRMYPSYRQYPVNFSSASGSLGCPSNMRFYHTYDGKVYYCSA
ncbi:PREDICTED: uncharacterized protein LOC108559000 [Nicrophorus vespilloides]|uniref:Uncharacterized protein LOC108559000 n=1 Tax=Nicrophorus vespilloides TaxID=110193 RepID=A0ABM1MAJ9_NICVS|nr:PREDICTED: uncharacterized protein LOC108559000 [Nicrophorus vespilloides]